MEHKKGKRTFEDVVDEKLNCWCFNIANEMLKEANIDASFKTENEGVKSTRIILTKLNFDVEEK